MNPDLELKIIKKMLYAYEKKLGELMGFEPVQQGENFIAAMTEGYRECRSQLEKAGVQIIEPEETVS